MLYITRNNSPINDQEFASFEDAVSDFCAPDWAGASEKTITMVDGGFKYMGETYVVCEGRNPKAARAEAVTANPEKFSGETATDKQIKYLRVLKSRVPGSAWNHWVGDDLYNINKAAASRAISALSDMATY